MDELDEDCRKTVDDYTRLEAKNTRLNTAVGVACRAIIEDECKGEAVSTATRIWRAVFYFAKANFRPRLKRAAS